MVLVTGNITRASKYTRNFLESPKSFQVIHDAGKRTQKLFADLKDLAYFVFEVCE